MPRAIETLAWCDGEILPVQEIRLSVLSHTLHYGTGVFEGIRSYRQQDGAGGVFRLDDHLDRLLRSARILGIELPFPREVLHDATIEVLRANRLAEAYIRPLVWLDEGQMGVAGGDNPVRCMIACWEWGAYLGDEGLRKGIRVFVAGNERAAAAASLPRAKVVGQYVTSFLVKRAAIALGVDEGLLLDRDGYVAEGTGENVFVVHDGELLTPPASQALLPGITRASVLELAAREGIPARECPLRLDDLYAADEVFLTGTAAEVTPVREIDGRPIPATPGPITRTLQDRYLAAVRGDYPTWITRYELGTG